MHKKYIGKFKNIKSLVHKDNPIIVEVGAHYGEDSLRFREMFKDAMIYCFEPDPRNIAVIDKYVKDDKIKLFEYAISDNSNKIVDFYQSYVEGASDVPEKYNWISQEDYNMLNLNGSGSSSLKKGYKYATDIIQVETMRLDKWAKDNDVDEIDFLWIDVQGAERNVLEGIGSLFSRIKNIWIEYGESEYEGYLSKQETVGFLNERGYLLLNKLSSGGAKGDLCFKKVSEEK